MAPRSDAHGRPGHGLFFQNKANPRKSPAPTPPYHPPPPFRVVWASVHYQGPCKIWMLPHYSFRHYHRLNPPKRRHVWSDLNNIHQIAVTRTLPANHLTSNSARRVWLRLWAARKLRRRDGGFEPCVPPLRPPPPSPISASLSPMFLSAHSAHRYSTSIDTEHRFTHE